jgi:hypothetical protein
MNDKKSDIAAELVKLQKTEPDYILPTLAEAAERISSLETTVPQLQEQIEVLSAHILALEAVIAVGISMRVAQKKFFVTKDRDALVQSKQLEKLFDERADAVENDDSVTIQFG